MNKVWWIIFSIRCLHREISAPYSNVTSLNIFHPLFHVRYYPSHHSSSRVCAGGRGFRERGYDFDFCFLILGMITDQGLFTWLWDERKGTMKQTQFTDKSPKQKLKLMLKVKKISETVPSSQSQTWKRKPLSPYSAFLSSFFWTIFLLPSAKKLFLIQNKTNV